MTRWKLRVFLKPYVEKVDVISEVLLQETPITVQRSIYNRPILKENWRKVMSSTTQEKEK